MSTRSDIIVHRTDGKWVRIYCHWDGYPEHNGKILLQHYITQEKAEALVALGDLSVLGPEIGKKHDFDLSAPNSCTAYKRDRGEKDVDANIFNTLSEAWPGSDTSTEYTYVRDQDGRWFVGDPDEGSQSLQPLESVLKGEVTIHSAVKAFGLNFVIGKH